MPFSGPVFFLTVCVPGLYPLIGWKIGPEVVYVAEGNGGDCGQMIEWAKSLGEFPGHSFVEHSGSGLELRTLDYENPGSNPGCSVKTLGKFFHFTLLQFTQLYK